MRAAYGSGLVPEEACATEIVVKRISQEEWRLFEELERLNHLAGGECTLRIAGGWVRDKLLGRNMERTAVVVADIDISLDALSGREWAERAGLRAHLIRENPARSKHLETATVRIRGCAVDLVRLRRERYAPHSRVPQVETDDAGPLEDAQRRDFTVNALFFNLRTRRVEDHLGRGLADLRARRLRTPLPPDETFRDDPLRALRAARFLAQLPGFHLDEELRAALAAPRLRHELLLKVSPERRLQELRLIAAAPEPAAQAAALALLQEAGLLPLLLEPALRPPDLAPGLALLLADDASQHARLLGALPEEERLPGLLCLLLGAAPQPQPEPGEQARRVAAHLRLSSRHAQLLRGGLEAVRAAEGLLRAAPAPVADALWSGGPARLAVARWLRACPPGAAWWRLAAHLAALRLPKTAARDVQALEHAVERTDLEAAARQAPLLHGEEVAALTGARGRQLGLWIARLLDWQLAQPVRPDKSLARAYLLEEASASSPAGEPS